MNHDNNGGFEELETSDDVLNALFDFTRTDLGFLLEGGRFELAQDWVSQDSVMARVSLRSSNITMKVEYRPLPNTRNEQGWTFRWLRHRSDSGAERTYPFSSIAGMGRLIHLKPVPRFLPFPSPESIERLQEWVFDVDDLAAQSDSFWDERYEKYRPNG